MEATGGVEEAAVAALEDDETVVVEEDGAVEVEEDGAVGVEVVAEEVAAEISGNISSCSWCSSPTSLHE